MQRVTRATAVGSLPAPPASPGTPGYFRKPDPLTGATEPGYEWFNNVQESLMAFLTAAGISPSQTDYTRMLQACGVLFGGGGSIGANVGYQWLPGRLLLQWGVVAPIARTLSAQVVVTFPLAFPNACHVVIPGIDYGNAGLMDMAPACDTATLTQVNLLAGTTIATGEGVESRVFGWRWIALGR